jgi:hypothetical protein
MGTREVLIKIMTVIAVKKVTNATVQQKENESE